MKPCKSCLETYGKHLCTHLGCCVFEGTSEVSFKGILKEHMRYLETASILGPGEKSLSST